MQPINKPIALSNQAVQTAGSLDGSGAGDNDQPYRFGRRPRAIVPYPFSTRQFARLLVLRGRVQDGLLAA